MGEIMIGGHSVQDEVQGVGIVQNNSLPGVAGSGKIMVGGHSVQDEVQGVGIVQNNSLPGVAGSG